MRREGQADFLERAVGLAQAGDEAQAAPAEAARAEELQLPQRGQQREACKEQPAQRHGRDSEHHITMLTHAFCVSEAANCA